MCILRLNLILQKLAIIFNVYMKAKSNILRENLYEIASAQNGYFTSRQAQEAGYHSNNFSYYTKVASWKKAFNGVYRLVNYPISEEEQYSLWSLWVGLEEGTPIGAYSHLTALHYHGMSEVISPKLQITVPINYKTFRQTPEILEIYKEDFSTKDLIYKDGYCVTTLKKTLLDVAKKKMMQIDHLASAIHKAYTEHHIDKNYIYDNPEFSVVLSSITKIIEQ